MVTAKNTYYIMAVNLLYTLTVIASITLKFNDMPVAKWLQVFNEIVYVTPMLYVVMILKHLKEDESIIATYKIFIGIDIFISLYFVVVKMTANNVGLYYLFFLLSIIAGIIFTIQSARIQNKWLGYPLLTYGLMFLFVILLQLIASIIYSSQLFKYVSVTEMLIPIMTFYILFKIGRNLSQKHQLDPDNV
jgi:hypothetical protein